MKRLRSAVSAIVLFLAVGSYAGQYQLKPATTTPPFKNPDGGQIQYTNATLPYVGSSSAWGQSHQNDLNFVDCRGTITTVWVWVPDKIPGTQTDDPLDTPPEEVIVHEKCTASYSGWYFLSGLGDGDCDNGLGFDPVETFDDKINGQASCSVKLLCGSVCYRKEQEHYVPQNLHLATGFHTLGRGRACGDEHGR